MTKKSIKPVIDRLSFTIEVDQPLRSKSFERFEDVMNANKCRFVKDANYHMRRGRDMDAANSPSFSKRLYKDMATAVIGENDGKVSIQLNPMLLNKTAWLRFDFNPTQFTTEDIKNINKLARYLAVVPNEVSLSDRWKPTRMDVAVDFNTFHVGDVEIVKSGARRCKTIFNDVTGVKESTYIGASRSVNQALAYNKLAELNKKNGSYDDNPKDPLTRIEVRKLGKALEVGKYFPASIDDLDGIVNPYKKYQLYNRTRSWKDMNSVLFSPEFTATYICSGLQQALLDVDDPVLRKKILQELRAFERHDLSAPKIWRSNQRKSTFKVLKPFFKTVKKTSGGRK